MSRLLTLSLIVTVSICVPLLGQNKRVIYYGPTSGGVTTTSVPGIAPVGPDGSEIWFPGGAGSVPAGRNWNTATVSDFLAFDAIVFGDWTPGPGGGDITTAAWAEAIANRFVWSPTVSGNVVILGQDPSSHAAAQPGALQLFEQAIQFAAADPKPGPGLYVAVGEAFTYTDQFTDFELLQCLGDFKVVGFHGGTPADPCEGENIHNIGDVGPIGHAHPVTQGLSDAELSWTNCSSHAGFGEWPASFRPLAVATDVSSCKLTPDYFDDTAVPSRAAVCILATQPPVDGLTLTPVTTLVDLDQEATVTATYVNAAGTPIAGKKLVFMVRGRYPGEGTCVPADCRTDAEGKVEWTIPALIGLQVWNVFVDENENDMLDTGETLTSSFNIPTIPLVLNDPRIVTDYSAPWPSNGLYWRYFTFSTSGAADECGGATFEYSADLVNWEPAQFYWAGVGNWVIYTDWTHGILPPCDPFSYCHAGVFYRARSGLKVSEPVGYSFIKTPYQNWSIIVNQFEQPASNLNTLLPLHESMPFVDGVTLFKYTNDEIGYEVATFSAELLQWFPDLTLNPGEAAFIHNSSDFDLEIAFAGRVPTGHISKPLPVGFSLVGSIVPQAGRVQSDLGFEPLPWDTIFRWDDQALAYEIFTYEEWEPGTWSWSPSEPTVQVGEGFWLASGSESTWDRDLSADPDAPASLELVLSDDLAAPGDTVVAYVVGRSASGAVVAVDCPEITLEPEGLVSGNAPQVNGSVIQLPRLSKQLLNQNPVVDPTGRYADTDPTDPNVGKETGGVYRVTATVDGSSLVATGRLIVLPSGTAEFTIATKRYSQALSGTFNAMKQAGQTRDGGRVEAALATLQAIQAYPLNHHSALSFNEVAMPVDGWFVEATQMIGAGMQNAPDDALLGVTLEEMNQQLASIRTRVEQIDPTNLTQADVDDLSTIREDYQAIAEQFDALNPSALGVTQERDRLNRFVTDELVLLADLLTAKSIAMAEEMLARSGGLAAAGGGGNTLEEYWDFFSEAFSAASDLKGYLTGNIIQASLILVNNLENAMLASLINYLSPGGMQICETVASASITDVCPNWDGTYIAGDGFSGNPNRMWIVLIGCQPSLLIASLVQLDPKPTDGKGKVSLFIDIISIARTIQDYVNAVTQLPPGWASTGVFAVGRPQSVENSILCESDEGRDLMSPFGWPNVNVEGLPCLGTIIVFNRDLLSFVADNRLFLPDCE